jgi:hypothetical protein
MRASPGAGPHAAITSSRATSQQEAETGGAGAGAEDEFGIRQTPCPMLRRFRISAGRKPCRVSVSQTKLTLCGRSDHRQKIVCFGICRRSVGGVGMVILENEKTKWQNEKNIVISSSTLVSTCVFCCPSIVHGGVRLVRSKKQKHSSLEPEHHNSSFRADPSSNSNEERH